MKDITLKGSWIEEWANNMTYKQIAEMVLSIYADKNNLKYSCDDPFLINYLTNFLEENDVKTHNKIGDIKNSNLSALYSHADLILEFNTREGFETFIDEKEESIIIKKIV